MNAMMLQATRLTRANRLTEATALIQRMLRGDTALGMAAEDMAAEGMATDDLATDDLAPTASHAPVIDGEAETIGATDRPFSHAAATAPLYDFRAPGELPYRGNRSFVYWRPGWRRPAPASTPDLVPAGGKFIAAVYTNRAGSRAYKLYIPSGYQGQALPLLVMLHGGTQTPDDFAAGTRMNVVAEEQTCLVVYPAQPSHANPAKCWNWFRPDDQRRGQGEPSLVAGITREVMHDYAVDPQRVYIGGMSAGAAAAAVMGATYPDLYAAIGVHSGLACGAAHDLISAFTAMRQGNLVQSSQTGEVASVHGDGPTVPTIVFHGDRDTIVHPRNGDHVITRSKRTANWQKQVQRGQVPGGHAYTRTIHTDASGQATLEQWCIHGAGHAWSGGSSGGSYTDPRGPDAAREMLRFFLAHPARGCDISVGSESPRPEN